MDLIHRSATRLVLVALLGGLAVAVATPAVAGPEDAAAPCAPAPAECEKPACPECKCYECECCREPEAPPCPVKKYNNLRYAENWRPCLCVPCCDRGDWSDALKAVALTDNKMIWANFGGQARLRFESFENQGFGAPGSDADDNWALLRLRAHADVHVGEHFRAYVEGIFAKQWTRELGERAIDVNEGDLLNAFVEVNGQVAGGKAGLWLGRHELQLGKQRLVSPLDWANTRRTFQGAGAWWKRGFHKVEAFVTRPVTIEADSFDDEWNDDVVFWGVNYTNTCSTCLTWEVGILGLSRDAATYAGTTDEEDRYTILARADGKIEGTRFDYNVAAGYQFGEFGSGDISAGFAAAELGYKPCLPCWEPRFAVGLDWASGDDDSTDSDVGTFNQLFPLAHAYNGANDLLGRQNLIAAKFEITAKPMKKLTAKTQFHAFWRADENDASYNAGGGILRATGGSDEKFVGWSWDLVLKYAHDRHWTFLAGYSHFFTGDFIEETGADDDVSFFFLSAQFTF